MSTKRQKAEYTIPVAAAPYGKDRISEFPDEILHNILRHLDSPNQDAKAFALSRRWRSLWSSYPVLKFHQTTKAADGFAKFVDTSIERLSRNKQLRIKTLEVSLGSGDFQSYDLLERLLKLASERKVEEIVIRARVRKGICIPYRLLADSCAKILIQDGILLLPDSNSSSKIHDCPQQLGTMETLELGAIVPSRFLETLQLGEIGLVRKLRISNFPNLKSVKLGNCYCTREIEIEAARLQCLSLRCPSLLKMELTAPQLKHLDLELPGLALNYFQPLASWACTKLKLSSPKLETFHVLASRMLKEIELDAGPCLSRFVVSSFDPDTLKGLNRCKIFNAASCAWAVHFTPAFIRKTVRSFMGSVKDFIARFPRFQTVNITINKRTNIIPGEDDETDHEPCSMAAVVNHLELCTDVSSRYDQKALLKALFCKCRPKFFTVIHEGKNSTLLLQKLLENMLPNLSPIRGVRTPPPMWRECGLKDVKIVNGDVDRTTTCVVEEEGLIEVSKDTAKLLATKERVSFMLTWSE